MQGAAGGGQRTRTRDVHAIRETEREQCQRAQHDERLDAAAREDSVEHLEREQRGHEHRQVEQQARAGRQQHERPQWGGE